MMKKIILFNLVVLSGCVQREIIYKPSEEIDPLPKIDSPAVEAQNVADPLFATQWNLEKIGLTKDALSKNIFKGNANIRIAVLSTGVDYNHEDLQGRVEVNARELSGVDPNNKNIFNGIDDDQNGLIDDVVGYDVVGKDGFAYDRVGTGTAVAGIIGARQNNGKGLSGIMSDVRLIPIRYINDNGQTTLPHLLAALDAVLALRPQIVFLQTLAVKIGGRTFDPAIAKAEIAAIGSRLRLIAARNVPIVVGAGNNDALFGSEMIEKLFFNAGNVIVVTSSSPTDTLSFIANFSQQYVTTAAPGENIPVLGLNNTYTLASSTAMAAAHVAGVLGLILAKTGPLPVSQLIEKLATSEFEGTTNLKTASLGGNRLDLGKLALRM